MKETSLHFIYNIPYGKLPQVLHKNYIVNQEKIIL